MRIYADNAATTAPSRRAAEAMLSCLNEAYGNPSSLHREGQRAARALSGARERIASALGCRPSELTFTSGGSESDNQALRSAAALGAARGCRHIISTAVEHHAVLHTLRALSREGFEVTLLSPEAGTGLVSAEQVRLALRPDTALVSVMYANNEIGTVEPVEEIGALCHARGVLFHTDAVQAAGYLPIDLGRQPFDLLSLSAHKFHGPKGAGLLYARQGVRLASLIEGGAQEWGHRAGTENLPGIAGMAAALEEACALREERAARLIPLRDELIAGLARIPRSVLNGHPTQRLPGNVSFCFDGVDGASLVLALDRRGISASSGSACASGAPEPSHVLLAIGRSRAEARSGLRLSLGGDVTAGEIAFLIRATEEAVAQLRGSSRAELRNP